MHRPDTSSVRRRFAPRACLAVAALAGVTGSASGATIVWDGEPLVPGNWTEPTNWAGDVLPVAGDSAQVNNGGIAVIDAAQGPVTTGSVVLGNQLNETGTLRVTGGSLTTTTTDIRIGGNGNATVGNGVGTLEQTGGDIVMNAGNLNVAIGAAAEFADGTYIMSGGSLLINSGTIYAVGNRGNGTVNQSGGSAYVRGAAFNGAIPQSQLNLGRNAATAGSSGTYTLSGGDLTVALLRFGNADQTSGTPSVNTFNLQGTGLFRVGDINVVNPNEAGLVTNTFNFTGGTLVARNINLPALTNAGGRLSPATLEFGSAAGAQPTNAADVVTSQVGTMNINGAYTQAAPGVLLIDIGSAGNDLINVTGPAVLAGTVEVTELDGFDPSIGSFYDVLTSPDITGLLTPVGTTPGGNSYAASVVSGGAGEVLRLTVVPEPGALGMIGAVGLGLLARRRRRN